MSIIYCSRIQRALCHSKLSEAFPVLSPLYLCHFLIRYRYYSLQCSYPGDKSIVDIVPLFQLVTNHLGSLNPNTWDTP